MKKPARIALCLTALALGATARSVGGEDASWPQWRGPARDGLSTETNWTPVGRSETLWSIELGLGYSSVSIQNGLLYTMGYDEEGEVDVVWCLDALTGEEVWVHAYPAEIWDQYHGGGTLTTPSVDGDVVYTLNREGMFHSLDAKTGEVLWTRDYYEELDLEYPTWGFSGSPLVLEDQVLLNVGPVISISREDGSVLWKSKDYGHAYSTPADFELGGRELLAVFNGDGLAVIDRADGTQRNHVEWETQYDVNAATPIVVDDAIFVSSGYNHGGALLAITDGGFEPVWETKSLRTQMSGCVLIDDHLYGFDDSVLKCFGLDGEEKWRARGLGNGALMGSPGRLIVISGRGELVVAEATPEAYRELSKEQVIDDGGVFWTKPVLAGGLIYCRSSKGTLVCRDHRSEG